MQTRAGDEDAAELQALPISTEIDVDLREPLLRLLNHKQLLNRFIEMLFKSEQTY